MSYYLQSTPMGRNVSPRGESLLEEVKDTKDLVTMSLLARIQAPTNTLNTDLDSIVQNLVNISNTVQNQQADLEEKLDDIDDKIDEIGRDSLTIIKTITDQSGAITFSKAIVYSEPEELASPPEFRKVLVLSSPAALHQDSDAVANPIPDGTTSPAVLDTINIQPPINYTY